MGSFARAGRTEIGVKCSIQTMPQEGCNRQNSLQSSWISVCAGSDHYEFGVSKPPRVIEDRDNLWQHAKYEGLLRVGHQKP